MEAALRYESDSVSEFTLLKENVTIFFSFLNSPHPITSGVQAWAATQKEILRLPSSRAAAPPHSCRRGPQRDQFPPLLSHLPQKWAELSPEASWNLRTAKELTCPSVWTCGF